jgi:phosphoribosyl-ATP pyrophosphohydrolase
MPKTNPQETDFNILLTLQDILEQRKTAKVDDSYVSSLYQKGEEAILKKIAEESAEVIMASKDDEPNKIIYEIADLWFHTLVLLRFKDIEVNQIMQELSRRFGLSGLEEKANRNNN